MQEVTGSDQDLGGRIQEKKANHTNKIPNIDALYCRPLHAEFNGKRSQSDNSPT